MTTISEEQNKTAPGRLALVQAFVNTQYGHGRRAHVELASPEQLRSWLVARGLLADGTPITEGDVQRVFLLREELRSLLRANNDAEIDVAEQEMLNQLASNAPLTVRFHTGGLPTLESDIAGVDGAIARLIGIVFMAMAEGTWDRLKACRNDRCAKVFYDTSKNRSGAWCSMAGCGSRLKARAYRQRRAIHIIE